MAAPPARTPLELTPKFKTRSGEIIPAKQIPKALLWGTPKSTGAVKASGFADFFSYKYYDPSFCPAAGSAEKVANYTPPHIGVPMAGWSTPADVIDATTMRYWKDIFTWNPSLKGAEGGMKRSRSSLMMKSAMSPKL